jgi:hypothetical protein
MLVMRCGCQFSIDSRQQGLQGVGRYMYVNRAISAICNRFKECRFSREAGGQAHARLSGALPAQREQTLALCLEKEFMKFVR